MTAVQVRRPQRGGDTSLDSITESDAEPESDSGGGSESGGGRGTDPRSDAAGS